MTTNSWVMPVSRQYFSKLTRREFASPVSAQTLDAQTSRDSDGWDELLECVNRIGLLLDDEGFLPLTALVSELADVTKPPSAGGDTGTSRSALNS